MDSLTFRDIVRELRERGYIADGTPKKITITADECKVLVDVSYNCDIEFSKQGSFWQEENLRGKTNND